MADRARSAPVDTGAPARYRVGAWDFQTGHADLRYVRLGDREIVRRVFVTVRDPSWREIPPAHWWSEADDRDGWRLRLAARYDELPFAWQAELAIDPVSAAMSFHLTGVVSGDLRVNRLGLVVLHPAEELEGGSIETRGPGGGGWAAVTGRLLPQRVVDGLPTGLTAPFDRLTTRLRDGTRVGFTFTGELFEIEDQRNFGDSSFKSYGPPLAGGFPYLVPSGTSVEQGVRWTAGPAARPAGRAVRVGHGPLPGLGVVGSAFAHPFLERIRARVRRPEDVRVLGGLVRGLEVVLEVSGGAADPELVRAIAGLRPVRVLVTETARPVAAPGLVRDVRGALEAAGCAAAVGTAVEDYVVELNRGVPVEVDGDLDVTVSPAVHSGDPLTIAENVPALPEIVATLAELVPERAVSVTLTFGQGPPASPEAYGIALPWTIAAIGALAGSGVSAVTLGGDLFTPAAERAWRDVLAAFGRARTARRVAYETDVHDRRHRLSWSTPAGTESLIVNLGDHAHALPPPDRVRRRVLWPLAPASAETAPAGGVVWEESRA